MLQLRLLRIWHYYCDYNNTTLNAATAALHNEMGAAVGAACDAAAATAVREQRWKYHDNAALLFYESTTHTLPAVLMLLSGCFLACLVPEGWAKNGWMQLDPFWAPRRKT